jgi:hypothetical protein
MLPSHSSALLTSSTALSSSLSSSLLAAYPGTSTESRGNHVRLKPTEWTLLAEGNSKVVFAYVHRTRSRSVNLGSVYRCSAATPSEGAKGSEATEVSNDFIGKVIVVHKKGRLTADPVYLNNALKRFVDSQYFPLKRVAWVSSEELSLLLATSNICGQFEEAECCIEIETDLSHAEAVRSYQSSAGLGYRLKRELSVSRYDALSVELKLKCGLKSLSPFLSEPHTQIKKRLGKFKLMQYCKYFQMSSNGKEPRWGKMTEISKYDPCDLMSMDGRRIDTALKALLSCPQNNLGIRWNGELLFGWESEQSFPYSVARQALGPCFYHVAEEQVYNEFVRFLRSVVLKESIFSRIQLMQALDVIDVEGCSEVFRRLCDICGSESRARERLEAGVYSSCPENILEISERILSLHRNAARDRYTLFDSLKHDNDEHLSILVGLVGLMSNHAANTEVQSWVQSLNALGCVWLLECWLIALAAKDMSVIISIAVRDGDCDCENYQSGGLNYSVALVDYQPKPTNKIFEKIEKEAELCRQAEIGEMLVSSCGPVQTTY